MKTNGITFAEAAKTLNVSVATIRNWAKKEYFVLQTKNSITLESFDELILNVKNKSKLNSRANKSLKDSHNHEEHTKQIFVELKKVENAEFLGEKYEKGLSDSYRNKEGVYYTDKRIVLDMMKFSGDLKRKTFCDTCCGSGNFIIEAINLGISPENIYGFDVDPVAISITKQRIFEKTGYKSDNIIHGNFLDIAQHKYHNFFDYIYTNPPWGKKLSKQEKDSYSQIFSTGKSKDTSSLFFFAAMKCLKLTG